MDCCTAFFKVEIGSCVAAAAYIMDDAGLDGVNTAAGAVKAANATAVKVTAKLFYVDAVAVLVGAMERQQRRCEAAAVATKSAGDGSHNVGVKRQRWPPKVLV